MENIKRNGIRLLLVFIATIFAFICLPGSAFAGTQNIAVSGTMNYDEAQRCLDLVNQQRSAAGLKPLIMNAQIQRAAMLRAQECAFYCQHARPNGQAAYTAYGYYGSEKNITVTGVSDAAQQAMNNFMNSPGHRAAILDSAYQSAGIGCFEIGGWSYWIQAFDTLSLDNGTAGIGRVNTTAAIPVLDQYLNISISGNTKLQEGKSIQLTVQQANAVNSLGYSLYAGLNASNFSWSSSNGKVASVDGAGRVTGRTGGSATITAVLRSNKNIKASVAVTVSHIHKYASKVISPTARAKGYTLHTCSCGDSYKDNWKNPVKKMTVKLSKSTFTYTGKSQKPKVTVSVNGKKLSAKQYTVTYKNNKKVGTAKVVIKGKGTYKGCSKTVTFKIKPKKVTIISARSSKKSKVTVKWKKSAGVGGYQLQYARNKKFKNAATVTVSGSGKTSRTIGGLKSKKTYYVRMRGYKKVNGKKLYGSWSAVRKIRIK